jgi:hypothetical protein
MRRLIASRKLPKVVQKNAAPYDVWIDKVFRSPKYHVTRKSASIFQHFIPLEGVVGDTKNILSESDKKYVRLTKLSRVK